MLDEGRPFLSKLWCGVDSRYCRSVAKSCSIGVHGLKPPRSIGPLLALGLLGKRIVGSVGECGIGHMKA